jgi:hypothetical protein
MSYPKQAISWIKGWIEGGVEGHAKQIWLYMWWKTIAIHQEWEEGNNTFLGGERR